jgi:hypothetical protein
VSSNDVPTSDIDLADRILTVFDDPRYRDLALGLRDSFASATPFPHIVIDDFLPASLAESLAAAYPDPSTDDVPWRTHDNVNVSRRFLEDVQYFPPTLRRFADAVTARQFLLFLETISGIDCLIADPYFIGGGAMVSGRGDFLKSHADFNWHHKLQAHRRLNALLYLTPDWDAAWGGELELRSPDDGNVERRVAPAFNRLVVFAVSDEAVHGQPEPLRCPPDVYRRVFSMFLYTTRRDDAEWNEPHFTLYRPENSPYGQSLLEDYQGRGA